ncbi:hypothetical protein V6N13_076190 [Hibiscus sabdariffa]
MCWNAQGCGHPKFLTAARQYIRDHKPTILGLVEPRISGARADLVISALGFPRSYRVEASGSVYMLSLVYASPSVSRRKVLWPHLRSLAASVNCPWVLMGDFNATIAASERKGGAGSVRASRDFQSFIFDSSLRDMGFKGPEFTWSRGFTFARLDRFLCNSHWDVSFPNSMVTHVLRMRSDHRPILLQVEALSPLRRSKIFRYFSGWCSHPDWQRMVQDNWSSSSSLSCTISNFTSAADVLRTQAASFFRSLYSDPEVSSGSYPYSGCFPSMPRHQMDSLASVPSPQEATVISSILTEFGYFSGHRVNVRKS